MFRVDTLLTLFPQKKPAPEDKHIFTFGDIMKYKRWGWEDIKEISNVVANKKNRTKYSAESPHY